MDMVSVSSSVIAAVGYENSCMDILFRSGKLYRCFSVPEDIYKAFLAAPSKGRFFNARIKNRYQPRYIQQVRPAPSKAAPPFHL